MNTCLGKCTKTSSSFWTRFTYEVWNLKVRSLGFGWFRISLISWFCLQRKHKSLIFDSFLVRTALGKKAHKEFMGCLASRWSNNNIGGIFFGTSHLVIFEYLDPTYLLDKLIPNTMMLWEELCLTIVTLCTNTQHLDYFAHRINVIVLWV